MFRFYYSSPIVIEHYRRPIDLPLMIPYTKYEVGIGYIGGKTIIVRSWGFSLMKIFTTHPADNQRNWHNLGIRGWMQGRADWS